MSMTHHTDGSLALIPRPAPTQGKQPDPRKWTIHRNRRGAPRWYQRWLEAWWIVTGKWSLHRAWQDGRDYGTLKEYERILINGGR